MLDAFNESLSYLLFDLSIIIPSDRHETQLNYVTCSVS